MTRIPSVEVDTLHHRIMVGIVGRGRRGTKPGEFHYPSSAVVINNRAYVADSWNHRVQVFDLPDWKFAFEFGDFFCPKWIEVVNHRNDAFLCVVDTNNARLCIHEPDGRRVGTFEFNTRRFPVAAHILNSEAIEIIFEDNSSETLDIEYLIRRPWWTARLEKPISIARDSRGFIYISDFGRHTVEKFDVDGNFIAEVLGPGVLTEGGRMLFNGDDLIVTDRPPNAVFIYNTAQGTHRRWEYPFDAPGFSGRDPNGNIWIGTYKEKPDPDGTTFPVFTSDYQFIRSVTFREVQQPTYIAFAAGRILIADQSTRTVFTFLPDGTFAGMLRDQPYDRHACSVVPDEDGQLYVGTYPIVDILKAADLNRTYYIDFENSAVRYTEEKSGPDGWGQTG